MIRNIIFDFDGVLVDSEILVAKAFSQYLSNLNIEFNEKDFATYAGNKTIDVVDKLSERFNIENKNQLYENIMNIASDIYTKTLTPVKGAENFLKKRNFRRFIASNSGKDRIIQGLNRVNFLKYFQESNIFSFDMVENPKPAPDVYLKVLESSKIEPRETIIIEDSVVGVKAGIATNIIVIGLISGGHWEGRNSQSLIDAGAFVVAKDYQHLLNIIKEL